MYENQTKGDFLMNKNGKVISLFLAITLCIPQTSLLSSAVAVCDNSDNKISSELSSVLENAEKDDFIPVGVTLKDLDALKIDKMIEQKSDFKVCDYVDINTYTERIVPKIVREAEEKYGIEIAHVMPITDPENDTIAYTADIYYDSSTSYGKSLSDMNYSERVEYILSKVSDKEKEKVAKENFGMSKITQSISEDIDSYLKIRRECVTEAYKAYNYDFIDEYVDDEQIITNLGFAPYLIVKVNKSEIYELSKDLNVEALSYMPYLKGENEMYNALSVSNASTVRDNNNYTGSGVKVGVLEVENGKYNSNYVMLNGCQNLNYTYLGSDTGVTNSHATLVTSIIKGKSVQYNGHTYKGVAPDATVYQACVNDSYSLGNNIEHLVQKGVSIINFSAGYSYKPSSYNNAYNDLDWIVDQAINNYGLVFVKSAGNTSDYVTSPGKAYNAITVGNCDSTSSVPYPICSSSGYVEASGLTNKPDIVAPGTSVTFPNMGSHTGTSLSAPIVSGVAAQMIQCMPTLKLPSASQNSYGGKTYYNTVKALILLGADYQKISTTNNNSKVVGTNISNNLLRDKSGAGLIDAKKTIDIILGNGYFRSIKSINLNSDGTSPNGMNSFTSFEEGEKLRAVLCFSKIKRNMNSDLNLCLYDSHNSFIAGSESANNNVEIIEYQFSTFSNYLISADVLSSNLSSGEILPGALVFYSEE